MIDSLKKLARSVKAFIETTVQVLTETPKDEKTVTNDSTSWLDKIGVVTGNDYMALHYAPGKGRNLMGSLSAKGFHARLDVDNEIVLVQLKELVTYGHRFGKDKALEYINSFFDRGWAVNPDENAQLND